MTKKLYAIIDEVGRTIVGPIMAYNHDGPAVRMFADACKNPNSLGPHAADYTLVTVGSIDNESGAILSTAYETVVTGEAVIATITMNESGAK